jgi:hypothetical protein
LQGVGQGRATCGGTAARGGKGGLGRIGAAGAAGSLGGVFEDREFVVGQVDSTR